MSKPIEALYSCSNEHCAMEVSWQEDMLRVAPSGKHYCHNCIEDHSTDWTDLPKWKSPQTLEIEKLKAANEWNFDMKAAPDDGTEFLGCTEKGVIQIIKLNKHLSIWVCTDGKESYREMTRWQYLPKT